MNFYFLFLSSDSHENGLESLCSYCSLGGDKEVHDGIVYKSV